MRARTLIATVATLLLLAGCGTESVKPKPYSKPSQASGTNRPPMSPSAASGVTEASATALVRYYLKMFAYASNTGDTDTLRAMGQPDCDSCNSVLRDIQSLYAKGGKLRDVAYGAKSPHTQRNSRGVSVYLVIVSGKQRLTPTRGAKTTINPGITTKARFDLTANSSNQWVVAQWTRL